MKPAAVFFPKLNCIPSVTYNVVVKLNKSAMLSYRIIMSKIFIGACFRKWRMSKAIFTTWVTQTVPLDPGLYQKHYFFIIEILFLKFGQNFLLTKLILVIENADLIINKIYF